MAKKKKKKGKPLSAAERPLFAPWNAVHETAKDKERKRSFQKKKLKQEMDEL